MKNFSKTGYIENQMEIVEIKKKIQKLRMG